MGILKASATVFMISVLCPILSEASTNSGSNSCSELLSFVATLETTAYKTAISTRPAEVTNLAVSLHTGGLVEFWVSGAGTYRGHVVSIEVDQYNSENIQFTIQGQFGDPKVFPLSISKEVRLLRSSTGIVETNFPDIHGSEIDEALRSKKIVRGSFEDAVIVARDAHGPQMYNGHSYLAHLNAVVEVLKRFGYADPDLKKAAVLHDVLEDTSLTYEDIKDRFGKKVADIVAAVTLPKAASRAEAFEIAYPLIRNTWGAPIVKLADRISNFEDAIRKAAKGDLYFFNKYSKEWPHFRDSLKGENTPAAMMNYLDHLNETREIKVIPI